MQITVPSLLALLPLVAGIAVPKPDNAHPIMASEVGQGTLPVPAKAMSTLMYAHPEHSISIFTIKTKPTLTPSHDYLSLTLTSAPSTPSLIPSETLTTTVIVDDLAIYQSKPSHASADADQMQIDIDVNLLALGGTATLNMTATSAMAETSKTTSPSLWHQTGTTELTIPTCCVVITTQAIVTGMRREAGLGSTDTNVFSTRPFVTPTLNCTCFDLPGTATTAGTVGVSSTDNPNTGRFSTAPLPTGEASWGFIQVVSSDNPNTGRFSTPSLPFSPGPDPTWHSTGL